MRVRVARWGHSLGFRIPRNIAADLGLNEGAFVEFKVVDGDLVVHPVQRSLDDLVEGITPDNVHRETDWGEREGQEAW